MSVLSPMQIFRLGFLAQRQNGIDPKNPHWIAGRQAGRNAASLATLGYRRKLDYEVTHRQSRAAPHEQTACGLDWTKMEIKVAPMSAKPPAFDCFWCGARP